MMKNPSRAAARLSVKRPSLRRSSQPPPLALVVEDHEDTRFLLRVALERQGYRVIEADNGIAALDLTQRERPDFILLDVELPCLNGLEVARRVRQLPAGGATPIIFLTAHADPSFSQETRAAGGDDCLVKPFSLERLYRVLERHLYLAAAANAQEGPPDTMRKLL